MPRKTVTIRFTYEQALQLGLITCVCGYPPNNHFDFGKRPCAFNTNCKGYNERVRFGTLIKNKTATKRRI